MPSHDHGGATSPHTHTGSALANFAGPSNVVDQPHLASFNEYPGVNPTNYQPTGWASTSHVHGLSINNATAGISAQGGGGAHTNVQPYTTGNYLIKT